MAFRYLENPFHEQHNSKANLKRLIYLVQFVYKNISLRYYATFKVRKFKSLFCKINTFLQKNYLLHWTAGRVNILCKYVIYIYFFQFRRGFRGFFFYVIYKSSSFLWYKNSELIFAALYFYLYEPKKCVSEF